MKASPYEPLLFILLCLFSCGNSAEEPEEYVYQPPQVETIIVESVEITPEISSFGTVSFRTKADVITTVDGSIETIFVQEGDVVEADAPLAVLSNIQLFIRSERAKAAVTAAEANLELSETRYKEGCRQIEAKLLSLEKGALQLNQKERELAQLEETLANKRKLFAVGGITEEAMQSLEMSYTSEETSLAIMRKDLDIQSIGFRDRDIREEGRIVPESEGERREIFSDINTRTLQAELHVAESQLVSAKTEWESALELQKELDLTAPIRGIIGGRYMEQGERAKADTKLFTVFDATRVDVIFHIPEKTGILLREGMAVQVTIDALGDQILPASVRQIAPLIDSQTGNITVKAELPNSDARLRPGMFARVTAIYGSPRKILLIPPTALANKRDDRGTVFLLVNGRAMKQDILLGEENQNRIEVIEGLNEGDKLIDSPSPILREGEEVDEKN